MIAARSRYERPADLQNELSVMNTVCSLWKCQAIKLNARRFNIDFIVFRVEKDFRVIDESEHCKKIEGASRSAFVEVRCRNNTSTKYPTMMLSNLKWLELKRYSEPNNPAIFLVSWTDKIGYVAYHQNLPHHREWGGRNQLRDDQDIEPVVHIPIAHFRMIHDH